MPLFVPLLLFFCLGAFGPMTRAQDARPVTLQLDRKLSEADSAQKANPPVFAEADEIEGRSEREVTLKGNATVRRDGAVVRGDRITYYEADDELFVVGNVRLNSQGNVFIGKTLRLKLDTQEGRFDEPNFRLPEYGGLGAAQAVEFLGQKRFRFVNGYYTTCQTDNPAWCLRAESITIDEEKGEGRARSASLYFGNAKVMALPVFFFPLGEERKTGFLPPSFAVTNRTGFEFAVPFYWNLAPNYDLTLTTRLMAKRGVMLGSQFRYLTDFQLGDFKYDYVVNDREAGGSSRSYLNWQHTVPNWSGWRIQSNIQKVSDDNYFVDFSRTVTTSALRILPREITATRSFGEWNFMARVQKYQSILDAAAAPPYERVPQFSLTRVSRDIEGFDLSVLADASLFRKPLAGAPEGWRAVFYPQLSYPIVRPGWFVTPKLGLHSAAYSLESNNGGPTSLRRNVPIFSLDAGLIFEKETRYFDRGLTQTLEPRLFYVRSPYRDQSNFPLFDSGALDNINFSQLFSTNTFSGNDLIADQNHLTTALVSRLIEPKSGAERFRFALGQRLYFSTQQVQIPGVVPSTDTRSDILAAATALLENHWSFDGALQYSVRDRVLPRVSLSTRFTPPDGRIFNAAIRYARDQLGQFDTSWRWPLAKRWTALGRLNYSFLDKRIDPLTGAVVPAERGLVESLAGFEYTDDCWVFRSVLQRYPTSATDFRTAFFFQIELTGLGKIGNDPFEILRRNIPGYRLPNDRIQSPNRFNGYE